MQKLFYEVASLDKRCYEEFNLREDILMEHASASMYEYIVKNIKNNNNQKSILIVCGAGNNGADGIALARILHSKYDVKLYVPFSTKSSMAKLQEKIAKAIGVNIVTKITKSDVVVDCLFGSGLNKDLDKQSQEIINILNSYEAYKIACDIPSGINHQGQISTVAFQADITITMGALKVSLFSDVAKDYVGEIIVSDLGIQREVYEKDSKLFLLDESDMKLPFRNKKNSHKGSFGHLNVIAGGKKGAGVIAAKAAFGFGCGLVSVVSHEDIDLPYHIMQTHFISENCTAIAIGMGLGIYEVNEIKEILAKGIPTIIDADLFHEGVILEVLEKEVVLTPHPKEFCSLLKLCGMGDVDIETLQDNRFSYVKSFCEKYPKVVLLLKGANVIIAQNDKMYINSFGSSILAKGGSGDVLSGLIGSLLAQGYNPIDAAISASLAHTKAASNYKKNNYSLIPADLVEEVRKL